MNSFGHTKTSDNGSYVWKNVSPIRVNILALPAEGTLMTHTLPHLVEEKLDDLMYRALIEAMASPDPSTQNGALLVSFTGDILVQACNEFPTGVRYTPDRWKRPLKYEFVAHAEENCVLFCARYGIRAAGGVLICPWAACASCARSIVNSGIEYLVRLPHTEEPNSWMSTIQIGDMILQEGGVTIRELSHETNYGVTLRRFGEPKQF